MKKTIKQLLIIFVASAVYAAGVSLFLDPSNLAPGGVTGISVILNRLSGIPTGTLYFLINVPIMLLGLWKFGVKSFFENKVDYISTNFGVTSFEDFKNIVDNLSYLQNKEIKYAEIIENSLSYNPYGKCSMFRLKVQSDNENDFTVFSVNAYVGKNTEYQQVPVIVLSAMGGMS